MASNRSTALSSREARAACRACGVLGRGLFSPRRTRHQGEQARSCGPAHIAVGDAQVKMGVHSTPPPAFRVPLRRARLPRNRQRMRINRTLAGPGAHSTAGSSKDAQRLTRCCRELARTVNGFRAFLLQRKDESLERGQGSREGDGVFVHKHGRHRPSAGRSRGHAYLGEHGRNCDLCTRGQSSVCQVRRGPRQGRAPARVALTRESRASRGASGASKTRPSAGATEEDRVEIRCDEDRGTIGEPEA